MSYYIDFKNEVIILLQVFPDYYPSFSCVGSACRHNCCIGWEIDIDEDTLRFYRSLSGPLGQRLKQHITSEDTPHFVLNHDDRCPFLNESNLCDLILSLGEDHLCQICRDHPRFRNNLPGRTETGIGLCCEAAGKLILGKSDPVKLCISGQDTEEDEIIALRDEVILLLQDRNYPISERITAVLCLCGTTLPTQDMTKWARYLLSLERLEDEWTHLLRLLENNWVNADYAGFDLHMKDRQTEYEQFAVYLVYRHLANAADGIDLAARAAFAALGFKILYTLGAILWTQNGSFTFDDQVQLARRFSAELEYSEDNLNALFDALTPFGT